MGAGCCTSGRLHKDRPADRKPHKFTFLSGNGGWSNLFSSDAEWGVFDGYCQCDEAGDSEAWYRFVHSDGSSETDAGLISLVCGTGPVLEVKLGALVLNRVDATTQSWADWAKGQDGLAWQSSRSAEFSTSSVPSFLIARLKVTCSGMASGRANRLLGTSLDSQQVSSKAITKLMQISFSYHGLEVEVQHSWDTGRRGTATMMDEFEDYKATYRFTNPDMEAVWQNMSNRVLLSHSAQIDPSTACAVSYVLALLAGKQSESVMRGKMSTMEELPAVGQTFYDH